MVLTMKFTLQRYRTWNHEIFGAIKQFIEVHEKAPHIILTNEATGERIDVAMTAELIEKDKASELKNIGMFSCELADLEFCLDNTLAERDFLLVHDDDAELIDPEDVEDESGKIPKASGF